MNEHRNHNKKLVSESPRSGRDSLLGGQDPSASCNIHSARRRLL